MPRMLCAIALSLLFLSSLTFASETVIHNFTSTGNGGINPAGGLLMDGAGNFYGSALDGTIFEFSPNSSGGWNYNVLCNCPATYPFGSLVMDHSGNLYGSDYWGQVYEYSPAASGKWTSTLLYTFSGAAGNGPSPLILDEEGNLYGTFGSGGTHGKGYAFELSQGSTGRWSLTHLHDFDGTDGTVSAANDAYSLLGGLIRDSSGNLYGTAGQGGSSKACSSGCGVIFELTNSAGKWTETILHSFDGSDGMNPDAPLLMDSSGNLYGTTTGGGKNGLGVVFEASKVAGKWTTTDLYSFTSSNGDGAYPNSALVMDSSGKLFGATESGGGSNNCNVENDTGCGTIFELKKETGSWKESVLVRFTAKSNGGFPGGVLLGQDGNLYGIAEVGGTYNVGLFFMTPR